MPYVRSLTDVLAGYLDWHLSRLKLMARFTSSVLTLTTANLWKISLALKAAPKQESKVSKKGRGRFRKVIDQAASALIQGEGPFATYYRRKRTEGMGHWKAMVAVMRKLCKVLYGLAKSGRPTTQSGCLPARASTRRLVYSRRS